MTDRPMEQVNCMLDTLYDVEYSQKYSSLSGIAAEKIIIHLKRYGLTDKQSEL